MNINNNNYIPITQTSQTLLHFLLATPHLVYPHLVYPHYVYYFDKVPHFVYSAIDTVPHLVYFHFVYIWSITYSKQKELSYICLHFYTYSNNINNTIM